jgi:RNA polymerase sigma-70 factor (ECF subfamily)
LDCDEFTETDRADTSAQWRAKKAELRDVQSWPDSLLVAAVRRDPPDEAALDALVERYWKPVFARCQLLTLSPQKASDLAQETWRRVLRSRHKLNPDGNLMGYLMTIATNLWRDAQRAARRAGPLAEHRLASLDAPLPGDEGETAVLADMVPDLYTMEAEQRTLLAMDIDRALKQLTPLARDVLVARYIVGESCADIGRRYRRTEQTISAWVRAALRQMKSFLGETRSGDLQEDNP